MRLVPDRVFLMNSRCNYYVMRATKNSKDYDLRNSGSIGGSAAVSGVQNAAAAGAAGSNLMTIPIQVGNHIHSKDQFSGGFAGQRVDSMRLG